MFVTQKIYRDFKRTLPNNIFKPHPARLVFLFTLYLLAAFSIYAIAAFDLPWFFNLGLGVALGYCWAIGGLIGHELLHGSIVKNRMAQEVLGFFCFLPFFISPTFWKFWHNNLHHSHTQKIIMDPDAYPTYRIYKQSRFIQWMYKYTPGSGTFRSYLYFFFWFTFNAQVAQYYFRFRNRIFDKLNHKRVNLELAVILAIHTGALTLIGPQNWLFAVFVPFLVMNYIPFSYISTNHNLSPLTSTNDPLVNTLTVTNHPILEFLHINFGYHVEHHLFPNMNGVHLKKVHLGLKDQFPDTYQVMPKWKAIRQLYSTARIYKTSKVLMNPFTNETYPTLAARAKVKETDQTPELHTLDQPLRQSPNQPAT